MLNKAERTTITALCEKIIGHQDTITYSKEAHTRAKALELMDDTICTLIGYCSTLEDCIPDDVTLDLETRFYIGAPNGQLEIPG